MIKKVELLAPAGSFEALQAAVQNGCDAVYLGGSMFGARAFANNFEEDEMIRAIHYAHGYGVKVYVTMNTLIMEDEMMEALAYAKFLYEANADALIIQDIGFFDACHQLYPDFELHASTQMHIHNEAGIQMIQEAGAKRVVVPRELSIEEVRSLAKCGVDLEVFVQGALCVSYSGQCLMSAKELKRSGNRGECAQMCRMRYRLVKDKQGKQTYVQTKGSYLLSPKDLNTLDHVPELIEAGIASFKIEGRMKRPAYVALMVSLYRKAIDAYYAKQTFYEKDVDKQMRLLFNRDYTSGYLFHQMGSALMHPFRPNHMGIVCGTICKANAKQITIQLCEDIHQGDGLRFLDDVEDQGCMVNKLYVQGKLVNKACKGEMVQLDYQGFVAKGAKVLKTSDHKQIQMLTNTYEKAQRKVLVHMHVDFQLNAPMLLQVWDDEGFYVSMKSTALIEKAIKTAMDKERLLAQLRKCGDTIFEVDTIHINMDEKTTLSIKEINQLRRDALSKLSDLRTHRVCELRFGTYHRSIALNQEKRLYVVVRTMKQVECLLAYPNIQLFVEGDALYKQVHKQNSKIGYYGERVMKHTYPEDDVIFSEHSGILTKGIADHFVNICNSYSAAFLFHQGVQAITFSSECTQAQRINMQKGFKERYGCEGNFIRYVYGHEELMISEYCLIHMCMKDNDKKNCGACQESTYYLEDVKGKRYPLIKDDACRMRILSATPYNEEASKSTSNLLHFYEETPDVIHTVLKKYMVEK